MVGCQVLRLAHPDQILLRPPLALLPDEVCLGRCPRAAQGIADARPGRSPQPSAPRTLVRGLCRPGDPPPSRPPLHLAPPVSPTGRVAAQRCALTQPHKENDPMTMMTLTQNERPVSSGF